MTLGHIIELLALAVVVIALFRDTNSRVGRIEHKLNLVLRHLGIDPSALSPVSDRVRELASDPSRKIEAIKLHREETGAGLADAKRAIDALSSSQ